jgi:hypothetical protein
MHAMRAAFFTLCAMAMAVAGIALGARPAFASITDSPGYFHLMNKGSGSCIDVGPPVEQWRCLNTFNEEWQFTDAGNGLVFIQSHASGLCLAQEDSSADGTPVVQAPCAGVSSQLWRVSNVGVDNSDGLPYYQLINLSFAQCLDLENGNKSNGVPMQVWTCEETDNQRWKLT